MALTLLNDDTAFLRVQLLLPARLGWRWAKENGMESSSIAQDTGTEALGVINTHSITVKYASSRLLKIRIPHLNPKPSTTGFPSDGQVQGSGAALLRFCTYFI